MLYGDEGKGTTVEYISKKFNCNFVVRFNGGPQAAHHIVRKIDYKWHCFSQFGSATLLSSKHVSLLSKYVFVSLHTLINEAEHLRKEMGVQYPMDQLRIDENCFIVTPLHKLVNNTLEHLRGKKRSYGTTGIGVGISVNEAFDAYPDFFPRGKELFEIEKNRGKNIVKKTCLQIKDLRNPQLLLQKLTFMFNEKKNAVLGFLEEYKRKEFQKNIFLPNYVSSDETLYDEEVYNKTSKFISEFIKKYNVDSLFKFYLDFAKHYNNFFVNGNEMIKKRIQQAQPIVFECAQGSLLDKVYGIYPHITKTLCSQDNAISLLKETKMDYNVVKIGVLRCYSSRHGNGPFITRNEVWENIEYMREKHNRNSGWQGVFRIGPFDFVAANYGINVFKDVDYISLTCIDKIITYHKRQNMKNSFPPFAVPFCLEYDLFKKDVDNYTKTLLDEGFEYVEQNDKFLIRKIKYLPAKKRYRELSLLHVLKKVHPKFIPIANVKYENESEKKLSLMVANYILQQNLMKKENENFKKIVDFVVLIQRILRKPVKILSFGPCVEDKIFFE